MRKVICDRCGKEVTIEYKVSIKQRLMQWEVDICQECLEFFKKEFKMIYHSGQDKEV